MKRRYISRLARKEYQQNFKNIIVYGFLILFLLFGVFYLGIPLLIKAATFWGNIKSSYTPTETDNQIAPSSPKIKSMFEATNSAQISLEGYAEPETMVEIFINQVSIAKTDSDDRGNFIFNNLALDPGRNEIYAQTINKNNLNSQPSEKISITFDNTAPQISISEPAENASIFNPDGKVIVKGSLDESAGLTVNGRLVILGADNNFSSTLNLSLGDNLIKIVAIDEAGNKSEKELKLKRE